MDSERPRLDPLAVTVLSVAALVAAGLAAWLFISMRSAPQEVAQREVPGVRERVADAAKQFLERFRDSAKPTPAPPAAKPRSPVAAATSDARRIGIELPAGKTWTYAVRLEPEVWKDAVLVYRSVAEQGRLAVHAEFRHDKGKFAFRLGNYAAGDRSHAQVRFPGFFMHGAYFDFPLTQGKQFAWEYPWQMGDNSLREGRVRRFEATVGAAEAVSVPAGRFEAVRLDVVVRYMEGGKALATVNEAIWYAPAVRQIVKIVRSGRSPDEAGQRIVADLAEIR